MRRRIVRKWLRRRGDRGETRTSVEKDVSGLLFRERVHLQTARLSTIMGFAGDKAKTLGRGSSGGHSWVPSAPAAEEKRRLDLSS